MALGFKVADGYVEVHAKYDKGELRRAAQNAADDNDKAYNKERERNSRSGSTRDTNRRIGKQANADFVRGVREQATRQKENPFIRVDDVKRDASRLGRVHVAEFGKSVNEDVDRRRNLFQRIGGKISRHLRSGMLRDVATAGPAFGQRFIEAITFGQADMQKVATTGKVSRVFAAVGTAVGATLAVALVAEIANAVTALLPLALGGAILALPIISIFKKHSEVKAGKRKWDNSEVGKAMKEMLAQASKLGAALEKIFTPAFTTIVAGLGATMKALQKPLSDLVTALTPAAVDLATGFFAAIQTFAAEIGPSMPGIAAGFREWGRQLPGIASSLAGLFNVILANPALVVNAIRDFAETLHLIAGVAGVLVPFFTRLAHVLHLVGNGFTLGARAANLLLPLLQKLFKPFNGWEAWFKPFMTKFVAFFRDLPGKVIAAVGGLGDKIAAKIKGGQDKITAWAKGIVTKVVAFFKQLPGKAASAVGSLGDKIAAKIKGAQDRATARARDLVNRVVAFLKSLPGKAHSAVSGLWSRMSGSFTSMVSNAAAKGRQMVSRFISAITSLPSKAAAVARRVKGAVQGALAGAGSWLVSAGRAIMNGLANGIRSGYNAVVGAIRRVASAAVAAAKSALKIGSPSKVFAKEVGRPIMDGLVQGLKDASPKVAKWLKKFFDRIADKKTTTAVVNRLKEIGKAYDKVFDAKNKKLDSISAKLKAQKDQLTQLREAAAEYAKSIKDSAVGDITQNISPGNIVGGLQARLAAQTSFLANLEALKKLGLDRGALQQILDSGAGTGNAFAEALLSDPAQIQVVNDLQAKLRVIGAKLGQFGKATFHDAGINAAKGLIHGLESQEKQLIKAIERLAHKLVAAFKKKLGIHSPSTVFAEEVGKPSAQGIGKGLRDQLPREMDSIRGMVPRGIGKGTLDGRSYHSSSSFNPTIHVHVAAGLDPVNAAARRALTKDLFLALEQYRKDYVK